MEDLAKEVLHSRHEWIEIAKTGLIDLSLACSIVKL